MDITPKVNVIAANYLFDCCGGHWHGARVHIPGIVGSFPTPATRIKYTLCPTPGLRSRWRYNWWMDGHEDRYLQRVPFKREFCEMMDKNE